MLKQSDWAIRWLTWCIDLNPSELSHTQSWRHPKSNPHHPNQPCSETHKKQWAYHSFTSDRFSLFILTPCTDLRLFRRQLALWPHKNVNFTVAYRQRKNYSCSTYLGTYFIPALFQKHHTGAVLLLVSDRRDQTICSSPERLILYFNLGQQHYEYSCRNSDWERSRIWTISLRFYAENCVFKFLKCDAFHYKWSNNRFCRQDTTIP